MKLLSKLTQDYSFTKLLSIRLSKLEMGSIGNLSRESISRKAKDLPLKVVFIRNTPSFQRATIHKYTNFLSRVLDIYPYKWRRLSWIKLKEYFKIQLQRPNKPAKSQINPTTNHKMQSNGTNSNKKFAGKFWRTKKICYSKVIIGLKTSDIEH